MLRDRIRGGLLAAGIAAAGSVWADDAGMERAEKIVNARCFLCHGAKGEASSELYPRLAGQNAAYIAKQLGNFRSGARESVAMRQMAAGLSDEDMRALGEYFSRQSTAPHQIGDATVVARGRLVYEHGGAAGAASACVTCHGARAHGTEQLPRLAGQVASYLVAQLKSFGSRRRTNDNEVMHAIAARLAERDMHDVAEYLSSLD